MGFTCADITDSHPGGLLGDGLFDATVSLDANPFDVKRLFEKYGLEISSMAAHAHLSDPSTPAKFGTSEIMQSIKLASAIGVKYVVTTELEPQTDWGKRRSHEQMVMIVADKLIEPLRLAEDMNVKLLLESHGPLTGSIKGIKDIIAAVDNHPALGVNLDTGNSWLGGADPVEMATEFKSMIGHIHWKDLGEELEAERGTLFGCGFSNIALGEGVIDIEGVYQVIHDAGIPHCTLEIMGEGNLKKSDQYLSDLHEKYNGLEPAQ